MAQVSQIAPFDFIEATGSSEVGPGTDYPIGLPIEEAYKFCLINNWSEYNADSDLYLTCDASGLGCPVAELNFPTGDYNIYANPSGYPTSETGLVCLTSIIAQQVNYFYEYDFFCYQGNYDNPTAPFISFGMEMPVNGCSFGKKFGGLYYPRISAYIYGIVAQWIPNDPSAPRYGAIYSASSNLTQAYIDSILSDKITQKNIELTIDDNTITILGYQQIYPDTEFGVTADVDVSSFSLTPSSNWSYDP
jgi:hypothetical protein